ncbi:MAG: M48 family metalloprotease [Rhodospirillales bacterium]
MRIAARFSLAVALLVTPAACTINPATGEKSFTAFMSPADEERVGAEQHSQLVAQMGGAYGDAELGAYVERVGQTVARQTELPDGGYVFTVVNDDSVNAFALPGGYVHVTRGLLALAGNEAELAGVIAHELGHVVARHAAQRYSRTVAAGVGMSALNVIGTVLGVPPMAGDLAGYGAQAYLQDYSRDQEMEADRLAVRYMTRAGYDPNAMVTFFRKLDAQTRLQAALAGTGDTTERFDIMASHPRTADRLQQARGLVTTTGAAPAPATKRVGEDDYLSHIDGLVYGDAVEDGVRRGQDFIHPGLKIAFRVPPQFVLQNAPQQVIAVGPGRSMIVFSGASLDASRAEPMSSYLTRIWAPRARLTNVQTLTIDGLDAATAVTRASTEGGQVDVRLVAIRAPDRIYRFLFLSAPALTAQLAAPFKDTVTSLRRLSDAEAAAIRPLRVRIVAVRPGDTVQSLAAGMPFPGYAADLFRVLNGLDGGADALPAGPRVKVVSDGSGGSRAG